MDLSELRTALKERREDYSLSDAKLNRKINQSYLDICSRRKWGWLRREYTANMYAPVTLTGTAATVNFAANVGERFISFDDGSVVPAQLLMPPACGVGKRVIIDGDFYEFQYMSQPDQAIYPGVWFGWLDRPYQGRLFPDGGAPYYGEITFLFHEVALPVGAQSVVQTVLFSGSSSPLTLNAIQPAAMAYKNKDTLGLPTQYSVVEKEPIPRPTKPIRDFSQTNALATPGLGLQSYSAGAAGNLVGGSTYTYWYTNYCWLSGAESALSDPDTITLPASHNAVYLPDIAARKNYVIRVYRSKGRPVKSGPLTPAVVAEGHPRSGGQLPFLIRSWQFEEYLDGSSLAPPWLGAGGGQAFDLLSDDMLRERGPDSASSTFLSLYPIPNSGDSQARRKGDHEGTGGDELYILYQMEARAFSADSDRPQFDATYTNVLLDGAELLMLTANDEQSRAGHVQQRYEAGIQRMIMQDRLNFQQRALISRNSRGVRGKPNAWYGSLPNYGAGGLGGF